MAAAKENQHAQYIDETLSTKDIDFDAISLEQALIDFEVANARVIDLTRRVTSLSKELLALRSQAQIHQTTAAQALEQEQQLRELHSRIAAQEDETAALRSQISVHEQTIQHLRGQLSARQTVSIQQKEEHYILTELCKSRALKMTALLAPRLRSAIRQATAGK